MLPCSSGCGFFVLILKILNCVKSSIRPEIQKIREITFLPLCVYLHDIQLFAKTMIALVLIL